MGGSVRRWGSKRERREAVHDGATLPGQYYGLERSQTQAAIFRGKATSPIP